MICAAAMLVASGCGPREPFSHAQIKGKVTYEDGTPIEADRIRILFHPQTPPKDQKTHPRVGETDLNEDGTFENVSSHKYGDGVVVGEHKVTLIPLDENERELKVVPPEYMHPDTTPLTINTDDYSDDTGFELTVPKPPGVK